MKLFNNNIQKDNVVKYCFDVSKIMLAITVVAPIIEIGFTDPIVTICGLWITIIFFLIAYFLDSKEVT